MTNESIMNKPPSTPQNEKEGVIISLDDPQSFEHETIIELTEIVEDNESEDNTEIPVTVDNPKNRHKELEDEISKIGGKIQENRIIEGYILAKVEISNELYVATCAMEGAEISEVIATMREGIHMILKGDQPGFWILGGSYANHIDEEAGIKLCENIESIEGFFGLSKDIERELKNS